MFGKKSSHCQSCGMPLSKDPQGGGTEQDGSRSTRYCSHCYQNGTFTEPNMTAEQMQQRVYHKLRDMHFPGFIGKMLINNIPKLERWNHA